MTDTSTFRNKVSQAKQSTERIPKFIGIIYQMIEDPRYQEYVSWSSDGCAMLIKNPTEFAGYVLPIFFKHNNFSSFVRQLNLYSFRKKKHYPCDNAFVHGMFKRGQKGLLKYIKRKGNEKYPLSSQDLRIPFYGGQEEDPSYEELIRQNSYLKKVHQDLSEHVQNVEKRILDLTQQNKYLQSKYDKKKQDEQLLKKAVKQVSVIYGDESVKTVFSSVMHEINDFRENRKYVPDEYDLNIKSLPEKVPKNSNHVPEPFILPDAKDEHKLIENFFEERLETDNSTPTSEKSALEEITDELTPKRINTNFSSWSFHKSASQKRQFVPNSSAMQDIYFDSNFNPFEQN